MRQQPKILQEGLRSKDLKNLVFDTFTIDRFKSKMGEDSDVVVLGFKVKEKYPAIDLMEFIEKGYGFILDADISAGEEHDGHYYVFAEIERTPKLPKQIKELFSGIGQLTDCYDWKFRYQKANKDIDLNEETISQFVPTTKEDYQRKMLELKENDLKEFFNQGVTDLQLQENNTLIFSKPYSGNLSVKFVSIGNYEDVKKTLPGALDLSESGQSEILFLNKYLGNYEVNKLGNKFLIRNNKQAVVIEKENW